MPPHKDLTERAQLDEQFEQTKLTFWVNSVIGLITSLFYSALYNKWFLAVWFAVLVIILLIRFACFKAYQKADHTSDSILNWTRVYTAGTLITATWWAVLAILLILNLEGNQLPIIFLALVGLTGGNIVVSSYRQQIFLAFSTPILVLPGLVSLFNSEGIVIAMGAFSLALYIFTLIASRRLSQTLLKVIQLSFENRALIDELEKEKLLLEKTNKRLNEELQQKLSMTKWLAAGADQYAVNNQADSNDNFSAVIEDIWELAIERQLPLSLVVFEIDDSTGLWESDHNFEKKLAELKNEICTEIRSDDHFIKINDTEFAIILYQMATTDAVSLVNRLRKKLADSTPLSGSNGHVPLSLSCGVAGWVPDVTQNADELVAASRRAKDLSLKLGGNQVSIG